MSIEAWFGFFIVYKEKKIYSVNITTTIKVYILKELVKKYFQDVFQDIKANYTRPNYWNYK